MPRPAAAATVGRSRAAHPAPRTPRRAPRAARP